MPYRLRVVDTSLIEGDKSLKDEHLISPSYMTEEHGTNLWVEETGANITALLHARLSRYGIRFVRSSCKAYLILKEPLESTPGSVRVSTLAFLR